MKLKSSCAGLILLTLLVSGCFKSVYERATDIPKEGWKTSQVIIFDVPVTDTINSYNVSFTVRNTNDYPYSNLFLFATSYSPKGNMVKDTVEFTLADDKGKWLGSGIGDVFGNEQVYKQNIRFPYTGTYRFEVTQAMREDVLKGILDVGVKVEKVK